MALQQIIQHPTGTYSQYWKIRSITLNHTTGTGSVTVDDIIFSSAFFFLELPEYSSGTLARIEPDRSYYEIRIPNKEAVSIF